MYSPIKQQNVEYQLIYLSINGHQITKETSRLKI